MTKISTLLFSCLFIFLTAPAALAQTQVTGTVTDQKTGDKLAGVSITIRNASYGAVTDEQGRYRITVNEKPPFTIVATYIGYKTMEKEATAKGNYNFVLEPGTVIGNEVVVSATRTPERILESPVSVETFNARQVANNPSPSFYDALATMKGVEVSTQSFTFKSVTSRGFNSNGNVRFNQFVDGMDTQAPGLNFSVGNVIGVPDIDVESVEMLPGASSALYGAGGTNGTLLLRSRDPFRYPGLSVQFKQGISHIDGSQRQAAPFSDVAMRYAKSFNDRFGFKGVISYLQAQDWQGQDYRNLNRLDNTLKPLNRAQDPNYDGINSYGDEITNTFGPGAGLLNGQSVSRTGYLENELVNYNSRNLKLTGALHYKIGGKVEAIAQAQYGAGTSVYTGSDRYSLSNFNIGQYKLELRNDDFFVRAYTIQERSGDAYNATALATIINESWKPSSQWFTQYAQVYNGARLGAPQVLAPLGLNGPQDDAISHQIARGFADQGRPEAGSPQFNLLSDQIVRRPIGPAFGAKFQDKTNLYHYEAFYNFSKWFNNVFDFQLGVQHRIYDLNSGGTIFDDLNRDLKIREYGAFAQASKKVFDDKLKLGAAVRYDKNENFEGRFTPRFSAVYEFIRNNNLRVSYQTGFRNPTTQNQYIDLLVRANTRLIGGLDELLDKYFLRTNTAYTQASYAEFQRTGNVGALQRYTFNSSLKPESMQAYEVGYKGLLAEGKVLIDAYYYFNNYRNFISTLNLIQSPGDPTSGGNAQIFSTVVNNPEKVKTNGAAAGFDWLVGRFDVNGNVSWNKLTSGNSLTFDPQFNTPEWRYNLGLGSPKFAGNFGFNVNWRWQQGYFWSSSFASGNVSDFGTVDAQISLRLPKANSTIKFGGSNVLNRYYTTSFGNPSVGGVYYISLVYDQFGRL
ncbi:MAG: TonB-dependent receptor [Mucilaginibacter polytrichastri]|nr:TonB-dependent receptor [Mucilaginibacter polytrichastri]